MNTLLSVGGLLILVTVFDCCGASVLQFEPEPDFDVWAKGGWVDGQEKAWRFRWSGIWLRSKPEVGSDSHGKSYGSIKEYYKRRDIFRDSVKLVQTHNSNARSSYKLGVNQFADLTYEEFTQQYLLTAKQNCSATHKRKVNIGLGKGGRLPRSVDWRTKGVVSPVKNQGQCGSCWTFSTTGAMEAHMAIDTGAKLNLSEQQLVDCAQAFNNHGCSGGLPSQAFEYIHYSLGLMTEKDYPYTAKDGKCRFQADKAVAFVKAIVNITEYDEAGLQAAVAIYGPVSIAYQVASDFRLYKSGVYKSKVCKSDPQHVNHAVLVVGYDVTPEGEPYWIVKNSWGTKFGMEGYFWIYRGSNMCGLSDCASFPRTSKHPAKTYYQTGDHQPVSSP